MTRSTSGGADDGAGEAGVLHARHGDQSGHPTTLNIVRFFSGAGVFVHQPGRMVEMECVLAGPAGIDKQVKRVKARGAGIS